MTTRRLTDWLSAYTHHQRLSESPDDFHFWTGVWTVAGALRRKVWLDERQFQWTPNFYIVLVGPPGIVSKSTSIRGGSKLLNQIKGIHFGPKTMTWQFMTEAMQKAQQQIRYRDETGEERILPYSALNIAASELGALLRLDDDAFTSVLIDMWDSELGRWSRGTVTSGETEIINPWINLIGCTTPAWLENNMPEHMIGGGLTSRMVFVYGDKKRQFVAYPSDIIPPDQYKKEEEDLVHDLQIIANLRGIYTIDNKAREWGRAWYEQHWTKLPEHLRSPRLGGYVSRKQTHFHKLAMVISAARRDDLIIRADELQIAEQLITRTEQNMLKVFQAIGVGPQAKQVSEIHHLLRTYRSISTRALYRLCMNTMSLDDFKKAVLALREAGKAAAVTVEGQPGLTIVDEKE